MLREYIGGPENSLLRPAADSILDKDTTYNPLVLYGPTGTGKTLLARGFAHHWSRQYPQDNVVTTSGADFARGCAWDQRASADQRDPAEFVSGEYLPSEFDSADLLVLDNLDELRGHARAQRVLADLCDVFTGRGSRLIATSLHAPGALESLMPRLTSRLEAGLAVPVVIPGPAAREAVLRRLATARGWKLTTPAARDLAAARSMSVPQLNRALVELHQLSGDTNSLIDARLVHRYLESPARHNIVKPVDIRRAVARYFELTVADLKSASRLRATVTARGVYIYVVRELTGNSFRQIGTTLGGRDHTTVLHAYRKTEQLIGSDPSVALAIERLTSRWSAVIPGRTMSTRAK